MIMALAQMIDFAGLPIGAELRFVSVRGSVFQVRIIGCVDPRHGKEPPRAVRPGVLSF